MSLVIDFSLTSPPNPLSAGEGATYYLKIVRSLADAPLRREGATFYLKIVRSLAVKDSALIGSPPSPAERGRGRGQKSMNILEPYKTFCDD